MTPFSAKAIGATVAVVLFLCLAGAAVFSSVASSCATTPSPSTPLKGTSTAAGAGNPVARYDGAQLANAATIIAVGSSRAIPLRGLVIAVATAIQESGLRNLGNLAGANDHDSLGLFQQRPSQGWGTPDQLSDPVYAAGKFYDKLLTIDGWQTMPLTQAAQAVQASAYPDAYAQWEPDATALVAATYATIGGCVGGDGMSGGAETLPADFSFPPGTPTAVIIAVWWALQQLGTPYSFGGSCTAPHSGNPALECDCSSLVQEAYNAAGIALPRVTQDQQHAGQLVAMLADLLPGDLIFIPGSDGTMQDPGHVGLYIGRNLIVQAPHDGDVVKLSRLDTWASQVATIRRVAK